MGRDSGGDNLCRIWAIAARQPALEAEDEIVEASAPPVWLHRLQVATIVASGVLVSSGIAVLLFLA